MLRAQSSVHLPTLTVDGYNSSVGCIMEAMQRERLKFYERLHLARPRVQSVSFQGKVSVMDNQRRIEVFQQSGASEECRKMT